MLLLIDRYSSIICNRNIFTLVKTLVFSFLNLKTHQLIVILCQIEARTNIIMFTCTKLQKKFA